MSAHYKVTFTRLYFMIFTTIRTLAGFSQTDNYDPTHLYPVAELQTDFKFVRQTLEKTHPNLYLYTPKEKMDPFLDSLYQSIVKPLSEREFYNLVTLINSKVKDGHTMFLPGEEALDYYNQKCKFFPFYVAILNNRLYVNMNCSADTSIKEGAEIVSINGIHAKDIIKELLIRQIRDGNNQTYPGWILTTYFKEYFGFSFGHPDQFSITYKTANKDAVATTLNALSKDSIKFYRESKYSGKSAAQEEKQGIILETNKQSGIATLTIKSFDNDLLTSVYKQNFDSTIQKTFTQISEAHIKYFILDIRNNQGGDFEPGKLLLSYLLLQPIKYLPGSDEEEMILPKKNGYKGKLYILINGGSFSSTGILSSYLEATNRGVFIGEETAGNKFIISGNPIDTTLPNTKITFEISTTKYVIRNGHNSGRGVLPEDQVTNTIDDIISGRDRAKELVLSIILKKKE